MADTACNYTGPLIGGGSVRGRGIRPFAAAMDQPMDRGFGDDDVPYIYLISLVCPGGGGFRTTLDSPQ